MQKRLRTVDVDQEGGLAAAHEGDAADGDDEEGDVTALSEKYSGVKVKVNPEP